MIADLKKTHTEELVRIYESVAIEHGRGVVEGALAMTNRAAGTVAAVYCELRRRAEREAILPLLLSDYPNVRGWAGAHALEFAPKQGYAILQSLAKEKGLVGFSAHMTLKVWRKGKLRFPWPS